MHQFIPQDDWVLYYLLQASLAVLPSHQELSRFYIQTMKSVSKRLVLRMYVNTYYSTSTVCKATCMHYIVSLVDNVHRDPNLKRMLCKSCDTLLVPGVTSTHRVRGIAYTTMFIVKMHS